MILMSFSCSSKHNPDTYGAPYCSRPFQESSFDAIVFIKVQMQSFHVTPLPASVAFSIFVHRRSLLRLCNPPEKSDVAPIPWDTWGPPITRLLDSEVVAPQWLTSTAGERYAALNGQTEVVVLDFNHTRIKLLEDEGYGEIETNRGGDLYTWIKREPSHFIHDSLDNSISSALPYACHKLKNMGPFDSLLLDEERILGLRVSQCHLN
jgi:hypothetical protein